MTVEHSQLTEGDLHEPKGIASATEGQVYVADGSGSGDFRKVGKIILTAYIADVSTAGQIYVVSPYAGNIAKIYSALNGAITGSDAVLTAKIGGTAVTNGTITIAQSGSAAGDVDSCTPTAANSVTAGGAIEIETNGASTNVVPVMLTIVITPTE